MGAKATSQLVVYASQRGWLASVPDPKRLKSDSSKATRDETYEGRPSGKLPDIEGCYYLAAIFEDMGRCLSGPEVLTFSEIESYVNLTGTALSPEEVRIIRAMSVAYVNSYLDGGYADSVAPYADASDKVDIGEQLKKALSSRTIKMARGSKRV